MQARSLEDVSSTWNEYPSYTFLPVFCGPEKSYVFRFSKCFNALCERVYDSRFWSIYNVKAKGLTAVAGLVFQAKGDVVFYTEKAISSCSQGNSYDYIASKVKTNPWSFKGLDLIRYEEAGEVITDLCTVMGVDGTLEL